MSDILEVKNLNIGFKKDNKIQNYTDGVTFSIKQGEILCLVGESGCGKTITALSLMGLLPANAVITSGEINFGGINLLGIKEKQLNNIRGNEIAMVFQDAMNSFNPCFTIGNQIVETIRKHLNYDKKKARQYAIELLKQVGIKNYREVYHMYPHTLSGGMKQRAMIAMAIACKPKLLIADEPTTALDVTIQLQIMELLTRLSKENNMAILLITHDMGVVAEIADRVIVMYAGQCMEENDVYSIFDNPKHPYTRALLKSVPSVQNGKNVRLTSIDGVVPENYMELTGCRFAGRCPYAASQCKENIPYEHHVRCIKTQNLREETVHGK